MPDLGGDKYRGWVFFTTAVSCPILGLFLKKNLLEI